MVCIKCQAALVPGANWPKSRQHVYDYRCTPCVSAYQKAWRKDQPADTLRQYNLNSRPTQRAWKEAHIDEWRMQCREQAAKRRALAAANGPVDEISWRVVWGRDEGHCRIGIMCEFDFVPYLEMHLDHVIPITKGGTHTWNNVQTSCAPCNLSKAIAILERR